MARDDQRMHGGNTPGMVAGRGHEHGEEPVRLGGREPGAPAPDPSGDAAVPPGPAMDAVEHDGQANALGGDVATRSNTTSTPDDER